MKEVLEKVVFKFNEKAKNDDKLRNDLAGIERKIQLELKDGPKFNFTLKDAHVDGVNDGPIPTPDITIITDANTLNALLNREMGPMKAIALQKLKVKASLEDMLRLRKFF